jgi:hypothetical protein
VILTLDPPRGKNVELGLGLPTIRHRVKERPLLLELLGKLRLLERLLGVLGRFLVLGGSSSGLLGVFLLIGGFARLLLQRFLGLLLGDVGRLLLERFLGKLRLLERLLGLLEVRNVLNVRTVWLSLVLT